MASEAWHKHSERYLLPSSNVICAAEAWLIHSVLQEASRQEAGAPSLLLGRPKQPQVYDYSLIEVQSLVAKSCFLFLKKTF